MTRMLMVVALALVGTAGSAQAAGPGEVLLVGGLAPVPGGLPAADSGGLGDSPQSSPVSADGRYVAFMSDAESLSAAAQPDVVNVFRKDRVTGEVEFVSRATGADGAGQSGYGSEPRISANGQKIAWITDAGLDPADVDGTPDVYVRDLALDTTTLASPGTAQPVLGHDLSANGAFVALATEDVLGGAVDGNAEPDVYRRELATGTTVLVSRKHNVASAGNGESTDPSISGDGRWVAFASAATDLNALFAPGSPARDVFVRDLNSTSTYVVSREDGTNATGGNGESSSPEIAGTPAAAATVVVAYASTATNVDGVGGDVSFNSSVHRRRLADAGSELVSRATGVAGADADSRAHNPSVSADGQRVAFATDATNLGAGADYYGAYVRDFAANTTVLGSADNEYAVQPALSGDGAFLTWYDQSDTAATPDSDPDLANVLGRAYPGGATELISRPPGTVPFLAQAFQTAPGNVGESTLSADGRYAVFVSYSKRIPANPGGRTQIYRRDLRSGAIELVSRFTGPAGAPAEGSVSSPTISADGTRIAFRSYFSFDPAHPGGVAAVYVRDFPTSATTLVSRGDGAAGAVPDEDAQSPRLSAGGGHVAFASEATNLGAPGGDLHVYLRDIAGARTEIVDRASGALGAIADEQSDRPSVSGDGRLVAFQSRATNLDPDDPGPGTQTDIFVRDVAAQTTRLVSRRSGAAGANSTGFDGDAVISSDGRMLAFRSEDGTLAPEGGTWGTTDQIVLRDLDTHVNALASRATAGEVANANASHPSLSGDGSVVAFESQATNVLPGVGGDGRRAVFVRTMATGVASGPPAFGLLDNEPQHGSASPSLSDDGQCLAFDALGHNGFTGAAGDIRTRYVYVVTGSCPTPAPAGPATPPGTVPPKVGPRITGASMLRKRFRVGRRPTAKRSAAVGTGIRFTLSAAADVAIAFEKRGRGRRVKGRCVKATPKLRKRPACARWPLSGRLSRGDLPAGRVVVAFSGRVGRKALRPGRYRAVLRARNADGVSQPVRLAFRVVRR